MAFGQDGDTPSSSPQCSGGDNIGDAGKLNAQDIALGTSSSQISEAELEALAAAERAAVSKLKTKAIKAELARRQVKFGSKGSAKRGDLVDLLARARVDVNRTYTETMVRALVRARIMPNAITS